MTEAERLKRNEYANQYYHSNKAKVLEADKTRKQAKMDAMTPEELEAYRENRREISRRSYAKHREATLVRAKERNWNYDPEAAKGKRAKHYDKHPVKNLLKTVKARAKRKGLEFDLTPEWYMAEQVKGCAVTQHEFAEPRSGSPWIPHIDKIDPLRGYVMSNCRLVCAMYNQAKGMWSDSDVFEMVKLISIRTSDL